MIKRILFTILLLLVIAVGVLFVFFNKPLPQGETGAAAEAMTEKMLSALNKSAWDSTNTIKWIFKGVHTYVWDKQHNYVEVMWEDKRVVLNLGEWEKSKAYEADKEHIGDKRGELLGTAYAYFCNDSFWLIAPFKVKDEGVTRQIVVDENGVESLLVSYATGGVTPGDSYQWFINESGVPTHYNMWVSIIPIGGVKATWENWETTATGVKLSRLHQLGPLMLDMGEVQTGKSLTEIGISEDLFDEIK